MDWLFLIVFLPAIILPVVLLFGFVGCGLATEGIPGGDGNLPPGTEPRKPSAPKTLSAVALSEFAVLLTGDIDPNGSYKIEAWLKDEDSSNPAPIIDVGGDPAGLTVIMDPVEQVEGRTYIYQVRARYSDPNNAQTLLFSDPSPQSLATMWPAAPKDLVATPMGVGEIHLTWTNASAAAGEFSLEHRVFPNDFSEIYRGTDTWFLHTGLPEGLMSHDYRVFAIVVDGFEANVPQEVWSTESTVVTSAAFSPAFKPPPGTLNQDQSGLEGYCFVQRISETLLAYPGNKVRITLRGAATGSLTLDRVTISMVSASGDPWDSATDLTDVASIPVTLPANTSKTLDPVPFSLQAHDLLIAFDVNITPGQGNLSFGGPLTGADVYAKSGTSEAGVQDRTAGYYLASGYLYLIEQIDVLYE